MDLLKLATQLLTDYFKGDVSNNNAENALSKLLGDGRGGINIADIVGKMAKNGNLSDLVGSWLGDGANMNIQGDQLLELFGSDALASFSQTLGQSKEKASEGLGNILPKLIDQNSSSGDLLSSIGGFQGALGLAKKLF